MSESIPFPKQALSLRPIAEEPGHHLRPRPGSGSWDCILRIQTPLAIHSLFKGLGRNDAVYVPGSSLKGMVRNTMEILGGGCPRFYEGATKHFQVCSDDAACLACRIFGYLDNEQGWAGKVRFHDTARRKDARWGSYAVPFDRPPAADARDAWIVFDHRPPRRFEAGPVRFLEAGQDFLFRVEYLNLDQEEISLLRLALTLRHGSGADGMHFCHKLGYAKSAGFGACTVAIKNDQAPQAGSELDRYLVTFQALGEYRRL